MESVLGKAGFGGFVMEKNLCLKAVDGVLGP